MEHSLDELAVYRLYYFKCGNTGKESMEHGADCTHDYRGNGGWYVRRTCFFVD